MKLQKLVYVSHGWNLAFEGPLVHEPVEAWKWGPVFRSLYGEFDEFGSGEITRRATAFDGGRLSVCEIGITDYENPDSEVTSGFLESIWGIYGGYSAGELSNITHREGTPWATMFEQMGKTIKPFTVIPNDLIERHYKKLLNERSDS